MKVKSKEKKSFKKVNLSKKDKVSVKIFQGFKKDKDEEYTPKDKSKKYIFSRSKLLLNRKKRQRIVNFIFTLKLTNQEKEYSIRDSIGFDYIANGLLRKVKLFYKDYFNRDIKLKKISGLIKNDTYPKGKVYEIGFRVSK